MHWPSTLYDVIVVADVQAEPSGRKQEPLMIRFDVETDPVQENVEVAAVIASRVA
jgi:hypothetical protein